MNKVKPGEKRCLYHANGMDIYNHELYVTCAEPNGKGEYSVVKLTMGSTSEEWPYNRYTWENRTNAISHYKGNQFILLTETGAEGEEDKKIYKLCIVHFSAGKVVVDQTKYFMNTGYEVLRESITVTNTDYLLLRRKNWNIFLMVMCKPVEAGYYTLI